MPAERLQRERDANRQRPSSSPPLAGRMPALPDTQARLSNLPLPPLDDDEHGGEDDDAGEDARADAEGEGFANGSDAEVVREAEAAEADDGDERAEHDGKACVPDDVGDVSVA